MKTICKLLFVAALLHCGHSAFGQASGLLQIIGGTGAWPNGGVPAFQFPGTTNGVPAASTNTIENGVSTNYLDSSISAAPSSIVLPTPTNAVFSIKNYDNVGFTYQDVTGGTGATNVHGILVFLSYDGGITWPSVPNYTFTTTNAGTAGLTFTVATNLSCQGASALRPVLINESTNTATGNLTNVLLELNLKRDKYDMRISPD